MGKSDILIVPKGKTIYIRGKRFSSGQEIQPSFHRGNSDLKKSLDIKPKNTEKPEVNKPNG